MPKDEPTGVASAREGVTKDRMRLLHGKLSGLVALGCALALGVAVWQFTAQRGAEEKYRTAPAAKAEVTQTVSANGTLNPVVLVNVGTQVSGTVKKLLVDFNDRVKAGQVLLELDPALLEAQVRQDEANMASAKASLDLALANEERSKTLWAQDSIAKQALDTAVQARESAQAQVKQAEAQLAKDRTNLDYSVIRSPVSGVVVNRAVDIGQTVAASFQTPTLFQIAQDLSKMQIDSSFAEADVGNIKVGQPVQFTVDAFPERTFHASVRQVRLNPTTVQNVVTYDVVVAVDNPDQILMPGMTAYVNVQVAQHKDVLTVPNAALRYRPADAAEVAARAKPPARAEARSGTAYVLEAGKLRVVPVQTGISDGRVTEIVAGDLKDGDAVVVGALENPAEASQSTLRLRPF
ncbi:MAG TPA: efflux RND transporter periplasmic adaptor subunit [Casimicrobiaceae bacterium]|nr:efflux RND transporter periplasmic adaptor subunit [Casimicrobiaceae bacterium]